MCLDLRCESKHDVKSRGQLCNARVLERDKGHDDRSFCFGIADAVEDAVAFVLRFALDVTLCGPFLAALELEGKVNVPSATGIESRFDRAEIVFAAGAGQEPAKALKVRVAGSVAVAAVQINAVIVHLPDFDQRVADRVAAAVQNPTAEVGDLAHGRRERVVDDDEVVVGVQRKVVRVKWAFGLAWGAHQFLSQSARQCEQDGAPDKALEKDAPVEQEATMVRG